jgi:P2-related tail formation protein
MYGSAGQVNGEVSPMLSRSYETVFERMLEEVALAATDLDVPLTPFWPLRGADYDGGLLVIGRSVNGWVEDWTARQLREPSVRRLAVEWMRSDAEPVDGCRMPWVTDL